MMKSLYLMAIPSLLALATNAEARGFTISASGGPNDTNAIDGSFTSEGFEFLPSVTTSVHVKADTGYVIGLDAGASIDSVPNLSAHLELSYRANNLHGSYDIAFPDVPCECDGPLPALESVQSAAFIPFNALTGQESTTALMANARYEVRVYDELSLYGLAGVGIAQHSVELHGQGGVYGPNLDASEVGFAWQVGAGAAYEVAKGVKLDLSYRYAQMPPVARMIDVGFASVPIEADGTNQSVIGTLTFEFD